MAGNIDGECHPWVSLVEVFYSIDGVALADETVRSLAARDKVGLNAQWNGSSSEPLLHVRRCQNVIDTDAVGGGRYHQHSGGYRARPQRRKGDKCAHLRHFLFCPQLLLLL